MTEDRLITVAIHTYDRAVGLKSLLETEGVHAVLQNVNLSHPVVSSGVRVRIFERDLPLALRIIENAEIFKPQIASEPEKKAEIMVPIDFSDYSRQACQVAFQLAFTHKASIFLLHSFVDPYISKTLQLTDSLSYDIAEEQARESFEREADKLMAEYAQQLRDKIKRGELPPVKFSTEVTEGVPEEVIDQYAKDRNPILIVMGTRGAGKKERELVGSVTAEVLDTCRYPVFTVPETVVMSSPADIHNVVFFSNLEQADILALDAMYRIFSIDHFHVTLVNIPSKKQPVDVSQSIRSLERYCNDNYPAYTFSIETLTISNLEEDFKRITSQHPTDLIVVPNKKKNIFARLFNPGIAHRLLFHSDIPMMVIPV